MLKMDVQPGLSIASPSTGFYVLQQTVLLNSNLLVINYIVMVFDGMVKDVSEYDGQEAVLKKARVILQKYQKIKAGLGPLLFTLVTCITVNLILSSYYAFEVLYVNLTQNQFQHMII